MQKFCDFLLCRNSSINKEFNYEFYTSDAPLLSLEDRQKIADQRSQYYDTKFEPKSRSINKEFNYEFYTSDAPLLSPEDRQKIADQRAQYYNTKFDPKSRKIHKPTSIISREITEKQHDQVIRDWNS